MTTDFDAIIARFRSAEHLAEFMQTKLSYASAEQREHSKAHGCQWKQPQQTYRDGYGFCYDLASFALTALAQSNIASAKLLMVAWDEWGVRQNTAHVTCFYPVSTARFICFDNGKLYGPMDKAQLEQQTSRRHAIRYYRVFDAHEIPYRTPFNELGKLLRAANPVTGLAFA
ncbi:transglutaminase-like domain-containing protein [Aliagarivorans taiwanensis]|uniref:transglutaminase-like domain-containing protein n=1 Tax=Aliagarivorans taiwanensis TaxID=561966 RepID=UPI00042112BC|nr:transglutaminase-like domain-containing protein [Aliagarivorans taiwanensis]